ncbi:MAG: cadherin-like domain-containing protein [Oscillospiraceae bacterium]|nr:cadherin-like domain-containing protein [Oscillospiraceae bacterium]
MKLRTFFCALISVLCMAMPVMGASAAQVECDAAYCFSAADFAAQENLTGICITGIPDAEAGTVMLGQRVLQPGDVLTAEQVSQMTFHPLRRETDLEAQLSYLPIYEDRVESVATMSIAVIGKRDQQPVAEDSAMETYKNLPNEALLKVKDPEGQKLTFTVVRQPRRGDVVIREDGSFHYTPKKNKVGVDSFTYTATDPAGNVSREATVTITITKPTDSTQYTDTAGESCRFAAEWMKNTGIFVSESVSGNRCFRPDKDVSRGEFLTMLVGVLELEPDMEVSYTGFEGEAPVWLKPYLAAAMRSGLLSGLPDVQNLNMDEGITGAEAAVMLQNALDLSRLTDAAPAGSTGEDMMPQWAVEAMQTLSEYGITLDGEGNLTRADAAQVIYQVSLLAPDAPGTIALRMGN